MGKGINRMLDSILKSDNPIVRYGGATAIVFGSLYLLTSFGIIPMNSGWLIAVIILVMILMRNVGGRGLKFG